MHRVTGSIDPNATRPDEARSTMPSTPTSRRRPVLPVLLVLALGAGAAGCKEKPASFFGPGLAEEEPTAPPVSDLTGATTTAYEADSEATTCTPVPEPFETDATIEDTGSTTDGLPVLQIVFPDAPPGGEVRGAYDPSTGEFEGETGEVDAGGGLTAVERWSVTFTLPAGDYSGTSEVTFTDVESGSTCMILYDITGTTGGS